MILTVNKIGVGSENDPIRPDTDVKSWQMLEEKEYEFVIEVLD